MTEIERLAFWFRLRASDIFMLVCMALVLSGAFGVTGWVFVRAQRDSACMDACWACAMEGRVVEGECMCRGQVPHGEPRRAIAVDVCLYQARGG